MIGQRTVLGYRRFSGPTGPTWRFTVNTEAGNTGEKKTAVPFNLHNVSGKVWVDWGDDTVSELTSENYTASDATASIHEYDQAGTYTVTVQTPIWNRIYFLSAIDEVETNNPVNPLIPYIPSSTNTKQAPLYWWKRTITSVLDPLEKIAGRIDITTPSTPETLDNRFDFLFCNCTALTSIPVGLFDNNSFANATSIFYGCSVLSAIPSGLFDEQENITTFAKCFMNCIALASIPSSLFDENTLVTNFEHCFDGCETITAIPSGLFDENTAVLNFAYCFRSCSNLEHMPSHLFDFNTRVTNFGYTFENCVSLEEIQTGLFNENTAALNFYGCFKNCPTLTAIPEHLFDYNTAVTTFGQTFNYCTHIEHIPSGLFDNNTEVRSFDRTFIDCWALEEIPSGLFDNNTKVIEFYATFRRCTTLTTIPSGLFDHNNVSASLTFQYCFAECTGLADQTNPNVPAIPAGLFKNNTLAFNFAYVFFHCLSLTTIPLDLFWPDDPNDVITARTFEGIFAECKNLLAIPTGAHGLFDRCTGAVNLSRLFSYCEKIISVPQDLFRYCTLAKDFTATFSYCHALTTVPGDVFWYNTVAETFWGTFGSCIVLPDIPHWTDGGGVTHYVFDNNLHAKTFRKVFSDCSLLPSIYPYVFKNNTEATDFSFCFANMWAQTVTSIPVELFETNTLAESFEGAFSGCLYLTTVPERLFNNNPLVENFKELFKDCELLESIPANLFKKCTGHTKRYVTDISGCFDGCLRFYATSNNGTVGTTIDSNLLSDCPDIIKIKRFLFGCTALGDFTLNIVAPNIYFEEENATTHEIENTAASLFVSVKANTTRILNIPNNSDTALTFNAIASDLGLTINLT